MFSFSHNNTRKTIIYMFILGFMIGISSMDNITYLDDGVVNNDVNNTLEDIKSLKEEISKLKKSLNQDENIGIVFISAVTGAFIAQIIIRIFSVR